MRGKGEVGGAGGFGGNGTAVISGFVPVTGGLGTTGIGGIAMGVGFDVISVTFRDPEFIVGVVFCVGVKSV